MKRPRQDFLVNRADQLLSLKKRKEDDKEKSYTCSTCNKSFANPSNLKQHISTHLPLSYPCPECDKKYKAVRTLKQHFKKHIPDQLLPCLVCHKRFYSQHNLIKHMQTYHAIQPHLSIISEKKVSTQSIDTFPLYEPLDEHSSFPQEYKVCEADIQKLETYFTQWLQE